MLNEMFGDGDDPEELYREAIEKWGEEAQVGMFIEEIGEALTALNKISRNTNGLPVIDFVGELADLSIMIEQMLIIYDGEGYFNTIRTEKLQRLQRRLEK